MYTAEELIWATQLAYCDFDKRLVENIIKTKGTYPTVQELVSKEGYSIYYNYDDDDTPTGDKKTMKELPV